MKQADGGVQLTSIDEQKEAIIVPVAALAHPRPHQPNLPLWDLFKGSREDYIKFGIPLFEASIYGDWETAEAIINDRPELVRFSISQNGETALHIAASSRKSKRMQDFVRNLIEKMEKADLELQNKSSNTALCLAAAAGNAEMVEILDKKNPALLIQGSQQMMPLYMAALFGDHATVKYIYGRSKKLDEDGWNPQNRGWLFSKCVESNLFDIALEIVEHRPELASNADVLAVLARKPEALTATSNVLKKVFNWAYFRPSKPKAKQDCDALLLLRIIWENVSRKPNRKIDDILRGPPDTNKEDDRLPYSKEDQILHLLKVISENVIKMPIEIQKSTAESFVQIKKLTAPEEIQKKLNAWSFPARTLPRGNRKKTFSSRILFIAAEMGNTIFIVELIRKYPDLIWKVDDNNRSIFHIAVKHRHEGIYNLLYEIGSMKDLITPLKDKNDDNMLHLAAKSAKRKRLQDVSGVALQMQRELLWFKEVESMVPPSYRERRNKDGLTPHELFTKEHNELLVQGEKWMKATASQCMVVATLIATIVFTAAFTVPGGYHQTTGIPIFHSEATFMVYVVANALSLFASAASILMFLTCILASRYAECDFLQSLPLKLLLGLGFLFLSITTMTIGFSVSFFVLYKKGLTWMPSVISFCALLLVLLFLRLIYPLLGNVIRSTYGSRFLFRPKKRLLYNGSTKPKRNHFFSRCLSFVTFGYYDVHE